MHPTVLMPAFYAALVYGSSNQNADYTLHIDTTTPDSAVTVPADFFSFGFETAFLNHFSNDFSQNLVNSVGSRMSKPMILRVGGTSGDLVRFNKSQTEPTHCEGPFQCPHSSKNTYTLGPSYFESFKWFNKTQMTFQAPIYPKEQPDNWTIASMDYIRNAAKALGKDRIAGIALGNEPDYYKYDMKDYISRALELEGKIIKELGLKGAERSIFELGDIPNSVIKKGNNWGLTDVLENDINKNRFGKFAAQHYYQIDGQDDPSPDQRQALLMNHTAITSRFPPIDKSIKYINNNYNNLAYVISETGSAIGAQPVDFSASFGAALWAVDFHLLAMSRGVKRISNTMRPEATHSYWIPDNSGGSKTKGPAVHGIFASAPFIADFVGNGSIGKVVEIEIPGKPDLLSGYALYDQDTKAIERLALVNLKEWYPGLSPKRGNATVSLDVGDSIESVTIRRLHAQNGAAAMGLDLGGADDNVTWAGEQWTYTIDRGMGHIPTGHAIRETVKVENGQVVVVVPDSEAVIVTFN